MKENPTTLASEVENKNDVWNSPGNKDFTTSNKTDVLNSVEQCVVRKELFEKDANLYTDKNITECHLPELIVCYNDTTYNHVVKDICIDEGANVKDDFDTLKSKSSSHELIYECGNIKKEGIDRLKSPTVNYSSGDDDDDPKSSSESDSDRDTCDPVDELQTSECNGSVIGKSLEVGELSKQTSLKSLLELSDDPEEQSSQEEGITAYPILISATEESNNCVGPEDLNEEPIKLPNKDVVLDSISGDNKVQREAAESSFSVTLPNSGVIAYSGPINYSGSVSLRSDSSTTSTRSFAFPVLQNEWNSSPIRMAKAERGCFQRHRRWKQGLLCCKF